MLTRATLTLPVSCTAVALLTQSALGSRKKRRIGQLVAKRPVDRAYVTTAERNVLVEKSLPGVEGKIISINRVKRPPKWVGGKHYHSGPTYVYVLEGTFTVEKKGKPAQTFGAGELYEETMGNPMQAFNKSADGAPGRPGAERRRASDVPGRVASPLRVISA
jgi:quercetin dioxygenase-like cupin family protein